MNVTTWDPWETFSSFFLLVATENLLLARLKLIPLEFFSRLSVSTNPLHQCGFLFETSEFWDFGTQSQNKLKATSAFCPSAYFPRAEGKEKRREKGKRNEEKIWMD